MEQNFEITVLGAAGGPLDGFTSCYMVKPSDIHYETLLESNMTDYIVVVDAGTGLGKLIEIINDEMNNNRISMAQRFLNNYADTFTIDIFNKSSNPSLIVKKTLGFTNSHKSPITLSFELLNIINTFLITHSHLDHITGLVLNSPAYGAFSSKKVYALPETINSLKSYIFNDVIWPNLLTPKTGEFLKLIELKVQKLFNLNQCYDVIPFEISHGLKNDDEKYHSTSFLLRDKRKSKYLLVFGDIESDECSMEAINLKIWTNIAPLIIHGTLKTIVIECSSPNVPPDEPLYGHLTPIELFGELTRLSNIVRDLQPSIAEGKPSLEGINILISHVKDRNSLVDPKKQILEELNSLNERSGLKLNFVIILPGQSYVVP
ncbi:hypothetical protein WICMUC_000991 [Wickerhamomyces mucosus]|uniref:3',5'-cyclic-nucleotide phosphodiesterase n=1 Tax=Wickerhamomyces mucosus TaxID=1378264 RepID=A0A9P8TIB9_9ASCO|nr:hypothetical protein WICMUC_000991 [Wickerhamomyces mucosus]